MKKEEKEKLYYELLHKLAMNYANNLCEFELFFHKIVLNNSNYTMNDFKRELKEVFVYNDDDLKLIFNEKNAIIKKFINK